MPLKVPLNCVGVSVRIELANREGVWPKRPYECFWSKVGVSRIGQG